MNDLERRALLGDAEAQRECTEKGILLPCPCCGGTVRQYGRFCISYIKCDNCGLESYVTGERETDYDSVPFKCTIAYKVREKWNTRPAPPIGRCVECAYSGNWTDNQAICDLNNGDIVEPDFFCSYFELKERKENERA